MRRAVWATWYHYMSTDDKPVHELCSDKWCKYKIAQQKGDQFTHTTNLPEAVMLAIKPVYKVLALPELLKKCLHGKTQNPNECLNALIWKRCPKTTFVSNQTVKIATFDATAVFNDGNAARINILRRLGIIPGVFTERILQHIDEQRITKSELAMENLAKSVRQKKRGNKRTAEDEEGQKNYGYGLF